MTDIKLKACPHCGPGRSQVSLEQDDYDYWRVICGRCGSSSGTISNINCEVTSP